MSELDWNRLRSGDYRALDPEHQDVFNMVAAKDAEIERLMKCIRWHPSRCTRRPLVMTDIVERLHCLPSGWLDHLQAEDTVLEAASEIERLRAERDMPRDNYALDREADAEIERLRDEVVDVTRQCGRLRQENEYLGAAMASDGADACGHLVVAQAEIERLRNLLSEALESEISDYWYVRVREALSHE